MLIQRRQFIKARQDMHNSQMMDISLYASWPSPATSGISSTGSSTYEPRRHASIIIDGPDGILPAPSTSAEESKEYSDHMNSPSGSSPSQPQRHRSTPSLHSESPIPAIIVDLSPSQQKQRHAQSQEQHEHLSPPHSSTVLHSSPLSSSFTSISPEPPFPIHPTSVGGPEESPNLSPHAPDYRSISPLSPPLSPPPSSPPPTDQHLPLWHDSLPQELALSRRSWQDLMRRRSEIRTPQPSSERESGVDTFTLFYALDPAMDNMTFPEVNELLGQLQDSRWSSK